MMSVKNIVVVYDYAYINGGAAKVAIESAIELNKQGYNVFYFTAVGPICKQLKESNVTVICIDEEDINNAPRKEAVVKGIYNLKAKRQFRQFLQQLDKDATVVHLHGWTKALSSSVVSEARRQGYKVLLTLHDYFSICPNGGMYNYKKNEICSVTPMSLSCMCCNCDKRSYSQKAWRILRQIVQNRNVKDNKDIAYITISALNEKIIRQNINPRYIYRVENFVDTHYVSTSPKDNDLKAILFVGRLTREKGIDIYCDAISQIEENHCKGIVLGDGELREQLEIDYPNIEFAGWRDAKEVREYMSKAWVLVFPSRWYEGAPLTIIEALSCGLPCIVSDCTSAKEIIHDYENGFVFPTDNLDALTKRIKEILDDAIRSNLSENALKTFNKKDYSIVTHCKNLVSVYEDWMKR